MLKRLLLGTYTRKTSKGIYQMTLDTSLEQLSCAELLIEDLSPTYLTLAKNGLLFNVSSVEDQGAMASYRPKEDTFELVNKVSDVGAPPCYVAVDETRQLVYGANYHQGIIHVYRILKNGQLESADKVTHNDPTGPHKNQNGPHVHYTDLTPDQRLVVCDLGTDQLYTYDVSHEGKLSTVAQYLADPGTGPRHLVFHPNHRYAYMLGELDNTVTVLSYHSVDGTFTHVQKLSILPIDFKGESSGAAIRVSNDGRFVYASNRGHNSIVVYTIEEQGTHLTPIQWISTEGDHPRDFILDPENRFVIAANQHTNNLTLYRRNETTGLLTMLQKDVLVPECVCVHVE